MEYGRFIPESIKRVLRPVYQRFIASDVWWSFQNIRNKSKSRVELHQYWQRPWDGVNLPQEYLGGEAKSLFLVQLVKKYISSGKVLEIGCNVGRNLNYLFQAGFTDLKGIEISRNACQILNKVYPDMARQAQIYNNPVEEIIRTFRDNEFDVIFTMAVLQHIHKDSEWIFSEIVRITKGILITIEDERKFISWRHFPREYKKIFTHLGMKQVEEITLGEDVQLSGDIARVFIKK